MNRFVSNFTNRLDSKGRVSIPAPFRAVLARDGFEGLYVHPALDAPALDAGGNTLLNEIDAFLSTLSPYSDERDQLSTALFGTSEILKVDPEGRAILKSHPENKVVAIDRDPDAIAAGAPLAARLHGRLALVPGHFGDLDRLA